MFPFNIFIPRQAIFTKPEPTKTVLVYLSESPFFGTFLFLLFVMCARMICYLKFEEERRLKDEHYNNLITQYENYAANNQSLDENELELHNYYKNENFK